MGNNYSTLLHYLEAKPPLYAPSTAPFWDDEHISKQMLAAHLNPKMDAASRNHAFIGQSVRWIASICGIGASESLTNQPKSVKLLDLGCGPGIYAERLTKVGFSVTGIDFSRRSIEYAQNSAKEQKLDITYRYMNYLTLDDASEFDVAIMIYCDFGVLSREDRATLLKRVFRALKPGGLFIFDANTKEYLVDYREGRTTEFFESGFWSAEPHICIESNYLYPETNNYLDQYVVITDTKCECYNTWNQIHDESTIKTELVNAGFTAKAYYDDVAGNPLSNQSKTLCAIAAKEE